MKKVLIVIFALAFTPLCGSIISGTDGTLIGKWTLLKAETNGNSNQQAMMDRTMEYFPDGRFEGIINHFGTMQPFNQGRFAIINDTTMVTLHEENQKYFPVSFTYNYKIKSDTMHLYGYFLVPAEQGLIQPVYIDELWVKLEE